MSSEPASANDVAKLERKIDQQTEATRLLTVEMTKLAMTQTTITAQLAERCTTRAVLLDEARQDIEDLRKGLESTNNRIAWYSGAAAVLATLASVLVKTFMPSK